MSNEDLNKRLIELLDEKFGILTKVELNSESPVSIGTSETGSFQLLKHKGELMLLCVGQGDFLKTSPIQSIENVEEKDGTTTIRFKTRTSLYEAIIEKS